MKHFEITHLTEGRFAESPVLVTLSPPIVGTKVAVAMRLELAVAVEQVLESGATPELKVELERFADLYYYEPNRHNALQADLMHYLRRHDFYVELPKATTAEEKHAAKVGMLIAHHESDGPAVSNNYSFNSPWTEDRVHWTPLRTSVCGVITLAFAGTVAVLDLWILLILLLLTPALPWRASYENFHGRHTPKLVYFAYDLLDHKDKDAVKAFHAMARDASQEEVLSWISAYYWKRLVNEEVEANREELEVTMGGTMGELEEHNREHLTHILKTSIVGVGEVELLQAQRALLQELKRATHALH